MCLFSIIIPTYNLEKLICQTLESVMRSQCHTECELILVDDGSKDDTVKNAEGFLKEKSKMHYEIIRKENSGVSDTRNLGMEHAAGKYLIFCDGDDFFEPDLIERATEAVKEEPDMAVWRYRITQGEKSTVSQEERPAETFTGAQLMHAHLLEGYRIRLGSFAVKREMVIKNEISFTGGCSFAEDMEFIMKCILHSESVSYIPDILFCYAKRNGSLMYSYDIRRFEAPRAICRIQEYSAAMGPDILDEETKEYLNHGLYVLHYFYSLDACILQLPHRRACGELHRDYYKKYPDTERELKKALRGMQTKPVGISEKKLLILKLGMKLYTRIYYGRLG